MNDFFSLGQILWSDDPATQRAISLVIGFALLTAATVYLPLIIRLIRLSLLERKLHTLADQLGPSHSSSVVDDIKAVLISSPIQSIYEDFERRWTTAQLVEQADRAPVRLIDVLDERPLFPFGARRSLVPVLPGLLLAVGALAALIGLIQSLSDPGGQALDSGAQPAWMAAQLGLALRAAAWGFVCAMGASLTGRLIEGAFDARSHGLDEVVESTFGSISPGELAELTRRTQQTSLETLGRELTQFANELNERLDRGLQRIEQSTARSANLVSQEQRGALHTIVQELSLSVRQGVEHHLGELRGALQRAVEHQNSVAGGLAETFQSMVENSKTQDRVARTLNESAKSVEEAARAMRGSTIEMHPVLEHLGNTSESLSKTADRIGDTQLVVARTAEGVRTSLEHAASGVDDQRQFIEVSLTEIRQALLGLGDGLGDSLQRSLREVDDVLGKTVGLLRDTLAESNETIDRLSSPIRAVEGSSREIHLALDRVRSEVEVLGQWMNQASKPLRSGLVEVDGRAEEISRTMTEFTNHARQIDKTMEALRHEIHEESRRIQGAGSELGRRLQQTSDAVGLLESTTSEAARRSRPDAGATLPRERHWAHAPSERDDAARTNEPASPSMGAPYSSRPLSSDSTFSSSSPYTSPPAPDSHNEESAMSPAESESPASEGPDADSPSTSSSPSTSQRVPSPISPAASRDIAGSGYRVGAPKAQGPDPYQRFDNPEEPPSNLRHFPTPERELGQELKLSGLLGPRSEEPDEAGTASVPTVDGADDVTEDLPASPEENDPSKARKPKKRD